MPDFTWLSGEVTEVQRYINVARRGCERHTSRERRELWIACEQAPEAKYIVHSALMPARRGHRVLALLVADQLVALHNLHTGGAVNYVRTDPPRLWLSCETALAIVIALLVVAAMIVSDGRWPLGMLLAEVAAIPAIVLARWVRRRRTRHAIDEALREAAKESAPPAPQRKPLRRVQ